VEARDCTLAPEVRAVACKALNDLGMCGTPTVLCELPAVQPHLVYTPDLLHGIYLGLLEHLMGWIHGLLRKYHHLDCFDDTWQQLPQYPNLSMPTKPYRQVSQWTGKEMRTFG